jgi:hypothetical protein
MVKTKTRPAPRRRAARPVEPSLPVYFKQIVTFLNDARVPVVQQPDLLRTQNALKKAIELIYGPEPYIICLGEHPRFPPFI